MFSRIVPAFTLQNISSLGPLTVVGMIYGVAGATMAWAITHFFWVPHRFRYGILAAGGWGNYCDIRTSSSPIDGLPILKLSYIFFVQSDGRCNGAYRIRSVRWRE